MFPEASTGRRRKEAMPAPPAWPPPTALVTGAAVGIGRAIVERLEREGAEVLELDLLTGFDVSDPTAWQSVDRVELACLNAGITTSTASITELTADEYRRVVAVNVDGVVFGVRRLARELEEGDVIVVTASLAGLTGVENDPIYALTKHAVIGFVRSIAPASASTRSVPASPTRRWWRASCASRSRRRNFRCCARRRSPRQCSSRRGARGRARRGSSSRAELRSRIASAASPARASKGGRGSPRRSDPNPQPPSTGSDPLEAS